MKKGLLLIISFVLVTTLAFPITGYAATVTEINRELERVRQQMEKAARDKIRANENKKYYEEQSQDAQESVQEILGQIDSVSSKLTTVEGKIDTAEQKVIQAGQMLEDAEKRIDDRQALLQARMRLMYTDGYVSYLDVLLSSTSFEDFINRFDSLKAMLTNDNVILQQHRRDRDTIKKKKVEVEKSLQKIRKMYSDLTDVQNELSDKEAEKEHLIEVYKDKVEEQEEVSEEQEALLMKLAKRISKLEEEKRNASKNPPKSHYKGGRLGMPIKQYRISSGFGYRVHPISGRRKLHSGIDFAAPRGTNIYAAESGTVIIAQWWSGYGNTVIIDHGKGVWTLYGHIRNGGITVGKGQYVQRGQKIAEVGSTGFSTGNHLHFEVRINEQAVNPSSYIF